MQVSMLTFAAAALAASLGGGAPTAPDVELLRPAPGEVLVGGTEAVVAWRPRGALDPRIEEWEAFLSLDGGGFYAIRITPHLDLARRRFVFRVPDLPSDDARILLRFGDERREVGVDVPYRFAIRRPAFPTPPVRGRAAAGRGESARPGEPGVVAWVDGARDGSGRELVTAAPAPGARPVVAPGPDLSPSAVARRLDGPALAAAVVAARRTPPPPRTRTAFAEPPPTAILRLGCRQNE